MRPSNKQVQEDYDYLFDVYGHVDDLAHCDTNAEVLWRLYRNPCPKEARACRIYQMEMWFTLADEDMREKTENDPVVEHIRRRYHLAWKGVSA